MWFLLCCIFALTLFSSVSGDFTVMTLNTNIDKNYDIYNATARNITLQRIARHILRVNADIVALQEFAFGFVDADEQLAAILGSDWKSVGVGLGSIVILTKLQVKERPQGYREQHPWGGRMAEVRLPTDDLVYFYSVRVGRGDYQPRNTSLSVEELLKNEGGNNEISGKPDSEYNRIESIKNHLNTTFLREGLRDLNLNTVIMAGDFNSPSHLDWSEERKHEHNGLVVRWPVTAAMEEAGFLDTFRAVHPNRHPGNTWPSYGDARGQERIDYIFSQGRAYRPVQSYKYRGEIAPTSDTAGSDFPSDHYAVVTRFAPSYVKK